MDSVSSYDKSKPRVRSAAYPSYSIRSSVKLTEKIDAVFSSVAFNPGEVISDAIGLKGGAFLMQISTAVQYGLLEKKQGEGYRPSSLYQKIKRPLPDEKIEDSYKECFLNSDLYSKLAHEYNNKQLPNADGLANILDRIYNIKAGAATLATKVFFQNLEDLELIGPGNILQIDGGITPVEEVSLPPREDNPSVGNPYKFLNLTQSDTSTPQDILQLESGTKEILILLKGAREAKLIIPKDYTDDDFIRISKVVNGYLP